MIALACIYIASVFKEKDTTSWFEELRVDMNVVSLKWKEKNWIGKPKDLIGEKQMNKVNLFKICSAALYTF